MDVSDGVVAGWPGYLDRPMNIDAPGKRMEEHIHTSERKGAIIYRLVDPATKGETQESHAGLVQRRKVGS